MEYYSYEFDWSDFVNWFFSLPLFGQILVVIGLIVIAVLILIGVYYILKGIAYLIYYTCKGIYYIFKGIAIGIYRLITGTYRLLFGKPEPSTTKSETIEKEETTPEPKPVVQEIIEKTPHEIVRFCPECGVKLTDLSIQQINQHGFAYCTYCGNKVNLSLVNIEG